MNPREREVYDSYPQLLTGLIKWAADSTRFPLEEMVTAIARMGVTNAFIGPDGTKPIARETLVEHQELLELAMDFRDRYIELAMKSQRSA